MKALVTAVAVLIALLHVPGTARAAERECPPGEVAQPVPGHGTICVTATDPGDGGSSTPGGTTHSTGTAMCTSEGKQVPCVTGHGVWFASHQCYAQPMQPQPSPDSPAWQGHSPEAGQVWVCSVYPGPGTGGYWFFVSNGEEPALVDPGDVAQNAVDQLPLAVPVVHLAPSPPDMTYVGLDTWLWIDAAQWSDLSMTVTAGGTTVTVLAQTIRVEWDLTEGSVDCGSAGRPWTPGLTATSRTDCSYVFRTVSDRRARGGFEVSATLVYDVRWTCSGACLQQSGSLGEVEGLPGRSSIRVGERQSVVING